MVHRGWSRIEGSGGRECQRERKGNLVCLVPAVRGGGVEVENGVHEISAQWSWSLAVEVIRSNLGGCVY